MTLRRAVLACMVDQYPTHGARRENQKVGAVRDVGRVHPGEPEIGLVNEGGGLQSVIRTFVAHVAAGQPVQLVVDLVEELGDLGRGHGRLGSAQSATDDRVDYSIAVRRLQFALRIAHS